MSPHQVKLHNVNRKMAANQTNQNIKKAQEETKEGIKKQGHGCEIKLV